MTAEVPIIVCAAGAPWELRLVRAFQRREFGVVVARRCVDHGELLGTALDERPRAVLVDASLAWVDRDLVATLRRAGVEVLAVGVSARPLPDLGVRMVGEDVEPAELADVLHGLVPIPVVPSDTPDASARSWVGRGRTVVVWGGAGAPGRTTLALHLAVEAADRGRTTLLVDGDTWAASVAQLVEVDESPSVAQAARLAADGWPRPLERCLQVGPGGVRVLAGLPRAGLWPEIGAEAWRAVLAAAAAQFDVVIVDVAAPIEEDEELVADRIPFRRNAMTTTALDEADSVVLVANADPVGLRRAVMAYRTLVARTGHRAPVVVAMNRAPRSARRLQDCSRAVGEWVGVLPAAFLPDEPALRRTVWEGRPLHEIAPRSRWLRELRALLDEVAP